MYNRKDSYYLKAKKEGYKSRAAYKLMELNKKFRIIPKGGRVLDCGAAPGGWSQVALEIVGKAGFVLAVDYAEISGINNPNFHFIKGDLLDHQTVSQALEFAENGFDAVLSDMAPKTSGIKIQDHMRSIELVNLALEIAKKTLKKNGSFLVKIFDGEERENFTKSLKDYFSGIKIIRPDSTRKGSFEIYLAATGFNPNTKLDI